MGNIAFRLMFGNQEATDAAFAKAKHVVKLRVENNRLSPVAMEPRVAIGDYKAADDQYTLYSASQNPHGVRMEIVHIFHVPENQIRVISPDVGGGFGLKGGAYPRRSAGDVGVEEARPAGEMGRHPLRKHA